MARRNDDGHDQRNMRDGKPHCYSQLQHQNASGQEGQLGHQRGFIVKRLHLIFLFITALTMGLTGCGQQQQANNDKEDEDKEVAFPVEVADTTLDSVFASYAGTTTLEAEAEADIVAKTSGVVLELLVEEGDPVEAGQVVARLDGDRLRLEASRAKSTLDKLENDFNRSEGVYAKGLISHDQFEKLRFDLESQRATYEMTQLELSYIEVRSPIAGVVSERLVKAGKLVNQFESLFRVDDFDPLEAALFVPERELGNLRAGLDAQVSVDAAPGELFIGQVARISPIVDPATGTFKVTVELPQPDPRLKPGMFARINIVHDVRDSVVTVPRDALIIEDRGAYVFAIDWQESRVIEIDDDSNDSESNDDEEEDVKMTTTGYRSVRLPVQTGYVTAGRVEILDGLDVGQQVVTSGKGSLSDDVLLNVINLPDEEPSDAQIAEPSDGDETNPQSASQTAAVAGNAS